MLGGAATCAHGEARAITGAEFWDLYFRDRFVLLERGEDGWRGKLRTPSNMKIPGAFSGTTIAFEASYGGLTAYRYDADARFAIPEVLSMSLAGAVEAIIAEVYPYPSPAPFGAARMSIIFRELFPAGKPDLRDVESRLRDRPDETQARAALTWFIGERRDPASSGVLVEVLRRPMHFSVEGAAFAAIAKVNDKNRLPELLSLMTRANATGRWKYARLFERLLSTHALLSSWHEGDRYTDPRHWAAIIAASEAQDDQSIFWDLRYLTAIRRGAPMLRRSDPKFAALCAR